MDTMSIKEAASYLGVGRKMVDGLYRRGLLEAIKSPGNIRLTRSSVELYKEHRDARQRAGSYGVDNQPPRYDNQ